MFLTRYIKNKKKNLVHLVIFNTKKHSCFLLLKNNNTFLWSQTTCSNKYVNFRKTINNYYLIGLKLKLILIKFNLDFPILFYNNGNLNGNLKLLKQGLFF